MQTILSSCVFLFLFLFAAPPSAEACSCLQSGPPCQAFWNTDAVFSGQVVEIKDNPVKPTTAGDNKFAAMFRTRTVKLAVNETFRGTAEKSVEIETGMGGGDCGFAFENGQSYLVYAYRNRETGKLGASICTRTQVLSKAGEDLEYFRGLKDAKASGTVYGKVTKRLTRKSDDEYKPNPPLANILLTFAGNGGEYTATTDEKGEYRLSDLVGGEYTLRIKVPEGMWGAEKAEKIKIPDKGCHVTYHALSTKTFLSGKILNEEAAPAAKIKVSLIPLDQINERYQKDSHSDYTDEDGRYKFDSIPDGTYYLGVRIDRSNDTDLPYPRTFYPGTPDLKNAVPVTISEGQIIENFDFALSKKLSTRTVRGTVAMPDGKLAAKAYVCIEEVEYSDGSSCGSGIETDDKGQFTFAALNGLRYLIRSHINPIGGQRHAEPVEVAASGDVSGVKLVITEADGSCEKCRTWKRKKN